MTQYFIPLRSLLPGFIAAPIDRIPGLERILEAIGARDIKEQWNDTNIVMTGVGVITADASFELAGLEILFGQVPGDGSTTFRFEYSTDRGTLLHFLGTLAYDQLGGDDDPETFSGGAVTLDVELTPDEAEEPVLLVEGPPVRGRLIIRDLGFRIRLPKKHFQLGERIQIGGQTVGIKAAAGDDAVEIVLPQASLIIDTQAGISLELDADQVIDVPPVLVGDSGFGFEIDKAKIDLSETSGFAEVLSRPGFDESWRGIYIEEARVFGLNKLLPFLPERVDPKTDSALGVIEMSQWIMGSEGFTGSLDVVFADSVTNSDRLWKIGSLGVEFDHGELVRGGVEVVLRAGKLSNDFGTIGPDGDLALGFALRHHRAVEGAAAWGFDISVRTPGVENQGLLTLNQGALAAIQVGLFAALLGHGVVSGDPSGLLIVLLTVGLFLQQQEAIALERLTLDALKLRYITKPVDGHDVRFLDIVLDLQTTASFDFSKPAIFGPLVFLLGDVKTEQPLRIDTKGITISWALNLDDFAGEPNPPAVDPVTVSFDPESGITFDLGESSFLRAGALFQITQLGVGRWDGGIYFDVGLRATKNESDLAFNIAPAAFRLLFNNDGSFHDVQFNGLGFSLLVPGAVYCTGRFELADVTTIEARAFFIGNGTASSDDDHKLRRSYMWDLGVGVRHDELDNGDTSLVVTADLGFSTGIALGSSGIAVYGIFGHYATNARPDLGSGDVADWFRIREPKNQIAVSKFTSDPDGWGFGAGLVFGSAGDSGRVWNAKAGFMYSRPGPLLVIAGTAAIFTQRQQLKSRNEAALSAVMALDFGEDTFLLDALLTYKAPEDGKLLSLSVPVELFVDVNDNSATLWHFYLGEHLPVERRVAAQIINTIDASLYLMVDGQEIPNLAGTGFDIPGLAFALGGSARLEWGLTGGSVRLYLYAVAELHAAVDLTKPRLYFAHIHIEGGLVFKVYGIGFDLGVFTSLTAISPDPEGLWGDIGVKVNLPWPIPDVKFTVGFGSPPTDTMAAPSQPLVAGLSADVRGTNESRELTATGVTNDIPIDPTFSMAFGYPVRNADARIGSFNFDSVDTTTYHFASGNSGYRVRLLDFVLWKGEPGTGTRIDGPFPAKWINTGGNAPGGQTSRRSLELFSYEGIVASRYIGTTAGYNDGLFENWDPCPPPRDLPNHCYTFDAIDLGSPSSPLHLESDRGPGVTVSILEPDPMMETLRRFFGLTAAPAEVITAPMPVLRAPVEGVLRLPGVAGVVRPEQLSAVIQEGDPVASRVELRFRSGARAEVDILAHRSSKVEVEFFDGTTRLPGDRVEMVEFPVYDGLENVGPFESHRHLRFIATGPVTRAVTCAYYEKNKRSERWSPSHLLRTCVVYESDVRVVADEGASRNAWSDFWADLLDQDAGATDALILEPDTAYTLEAKLEWGALQAPEPDQTPVETATGLVTEAFRFHTVNESPKRLRGREDSIDTRVREWAVESQPFDASFDGLADDWSVATVPGDESFGFYPDRTLRLVFPDARTDAIFGAFGERLVLRLVDEDGVDLFDRLQFIKDNAPSLPEYQNMWVDWVTSHDCTPDDVGGLWQFGWAVFDSVLATNRWYDASLVASPESAIPIDANGDPDLSAFDFTTVEAVYRFRFKTSRWRELAQHVADVSIFDEICEDAPDLASLSASIDDATSGRIVDDLALGAAIVDHLHLPFRPSPETPELVRIWRVEADDSHALVALLLDGPEPLPDRAATLSLDDADGNAMDYVMVQGVSMTRALVLPRSGNAFAAPVTTHLTVGIQEPWIDAAGAAVRADASLVVDVTGPAFLETEVTP